MARQSHRLVGDPGCMSQRDGWSCLKEHDQKERIVVSAALAPLKDAKTIVLTTYKRDGTAVGTPVSIAFDGDRAFFRSYDKAWKTRRLRHDPRVQAAPSTIRGKLTGPAIRASATLLEGEQARVAARALARRHRVLQGIVVPAAHRLMRYRTMHYELRPDVG